MREPEAEQSILGTLEGLDGQRCTAARLAQAQSTRLSNGQKNISVKKMSFNSTTPYLKPFLQGEDLSRTPRVSPPASKGSSCALGPRAPSPGKQRVRPHLLQVPWPPTAWVVYGGTVTPSPTTGSPSVLVTAPDWSQGALPRGLACSGAPKSDSTQR